MPMVNGYQYAHHMLELGSRPLVGVEGPRIVHVAWLPGSHRFSDHLSWAIDLGRLLCVSTTEMNHIFRLLLGFALRRDLLPQDCAHAGRTEKGPEVPDFN
jgi:hypothetical protein